MKREELSIIVPFQDSHNQDKDASHFQALLAFPDFIAIFRKAPKYLDSCLTCGIPACNAAAVTPLILHKDRKHEDY